jgi:hypothetical protein
VRFLTVILALSKQQYENNFQKDKSIDAKTPSKAQVEKVMFCEALEKNMLSDTDLKAKA